jgi:hypothetical protein
MELAWFLALRSAGIAVRSAHSNVGRADAPMEHVDFDTPLFFGSSRTNCCPLDRWHACTSFICSCFTLGQSE